jgi:hypothetical protein
LVDYTNIVFRNCDHFGLSSNRLVGVNAS